MKHRTKKLLEVTAGVAAAVLGVRFLVKRHEAKARGVAGVGASSAAPELDVGGPPYGDFDMTYKGAHVHYANRQPPNPVQQMMMISWPCGTPQPGGSGFGGQLFKGILPGSWEAQAKLFIDQHIAGCAHAQAPSHTNATASLTPVIPPVHTHR